MLSVVAQAPGSRLVIVGTIRYADVVTKIKARLEAAGCKPSALEFPPLDRKAMRTVLERRLQLLPGPVFSPATVRDLILLVSLSCMQAFGCMWLCLQQCSHASVKIM